ncbi:hypothetical protein JI735_14720 [Paenibacillus sonchi]|uniref:Uncharacterized protein n=1 Tax=Paenibacillus sonchi TaxID=373687 RepID=A0A974PH00_9BACL|nr:hypothetical protein [Paenibacillus sonchi]QQZ63590.1 hypothetical protein JI735_14720 [Paenibacillus sonchi]
MKIAVILGLYILAFWRGCVLLQGHKRKLHRLWFGCILVYCAYVHICGITETSHFGVSALYIAYFQPAGRAIIKWLGG